MSDKRAPRRSLDDWMELVTECRQSGLTDAAWCEAQGISPSCFYNAVSRLRKRACQIPDPIGKASTLDLTSHKQDVVQIAIEPELSPAELFQDERSSSMYLDNSHTIEIEAKGLTIRMSNTVQPMLLKILMDAPIWNDIQEAFTGEDVEVLNIGDSVRARRIIDGTDAGRHMVLNTLERLNYL